jgi:phosphoglycerate dehydrogenase-like enzyme
VNSTERWQRCDPFWPIEQEPPAEDAPLVLAWRDPDHIARDRLIVNPHVAWYCEEGKREVLRKAAGTCRAPCSACPYGMS